MKDGTTHLAVVRSKDAYLLIAECFPKMLAKHLQAGVQSSNGETASGTTPFRVRQSGFVQRPAMLLLRWLSGDGCWRYPQQHSGLTFGSTNGDDSCSNFTNASSGFCITTK